MFAIVAENHIKVYFSYRHDIRREKMFQNNTSLHTLKRVPIDENLDDFEDSSTDIGNKLDTKEHFEAAKSVWCSATT